jgi:hypothetical protein
MKTSFLTSYAFLLSTAALSFVPGVVHADLESDAHRVLEHRLAMAVPVTVFDKWQADQWTFAAGECLVGLPARNSADTARLNKLPIYRAGSHSAAKVLEATCATLARFGPDAVCYDMASRSEPFAMPWAGYPLDYLFLAKAVLPLAGSVHTVGGSCQLVRNRAETNQFFAGPAKLKWLNPPASTPLRTAGKTQNILVGTVAFEVEGMPGGVSNPVMVLVP